MRDDEDDDTRVDNDSLNKGDYSFDASSRRANDSVSSNDTAVDPLDSGKPSSAIDTTIPITDWSQKAHLAKIICASLQEAPTMMAYVGLVWSALSNPENLNLEKIDIVPSSLEDVALLQENLLKFVSEVDVKAMASAGWIRVYQVLYSSAVVSATLGLLLFQTVLLLLYLCAGAVILLGSGILCKFDKAKHVVQGDKVSVKED